MRYISTRGQTPAQSFEDVLLTGLARDGGLFVPQSWPSITGDQLRAMRGKPYADIAFTVMQPFVVGSGSGSGSGGGGIDDATLGRIVTEAYATFDHHLVAPLVEIDPNRWVMELWHGPTLAFKDVAMQVLGRLYDEVLARRKERVTLIGATSGDTGSAAIEAVRHCAHADIFILHPHNRTSEVQRRQMTTVLSPNVHNIAIDGTFDDCQAMVKQMFNDPVFRDEIAMSAVNSINWARILPQVVYYFSAAVALGCPDVPVAFTVPTGNFGDIYAGYVALRMGLPIQRLVIASNINDILPRALNTGRHEMGEVHPTMSPSMDIQISSNFERLLFEAFDRDGTAVRSLMADLKSNKRFSLGEKQLGMMRNIFTAHRIDEAQTLDVIRRLHQRTGYVIDPHTAVGVGAAERESNDTAMVVLSTAHPAKFPDAVAKATGHRPALPQRLADLFEREERYDVLPNDLATVMKYVRGKLK
ncbi:MAG: threonine synthase [Phycisphaeraceae bacterium]